MNVVKILQVEKEPVVGPLTPLFNGPVTMQPIIDAS